MQKPRKRFLSAIVAVAMCLSQFAPVAAYAAESAGSGITQSEEAPKETATDAASTVNSSATTTAPASDSAASSNAASSDNKAPAENASEATSTASADSNTAVIDKTAAPSADENSDSTATPSSTISEAAQAFIDAANALVSRKDEILTAANNFGLASKAWQADKENAVLDAMVTRRSEELDAVYNWEPVEDMYYSLSEDEQVAAPVMSAYLDMSDLYMQVCDRQKNPVDNSGVSAFDGGGATTVVGNFQAITAAETGKQIAAGTSIQYTKIGGQDNVIRILPQTVTYTYGDSFKSNGLTVEYSTSDSRSTQEIEKDIQAAIDGLSFILYAPADGDGQNPTDVHCNAGTYPTYVDTGAVSVTVNGLNYTIIDGSNLDSSKNIRNDAGVTINKRQIYIVPHTTYVTKGNTISQINYTVMDTNGGLVDGDLLPADVLTTENFDKDTTGSYKIILGSSAKSNTNYNVDIQANTGDVYVVVSERTLTLTPVFVFKGNDGVTTTGAKATRQYGQVNPAVDFVITGWSDADKTNFEYKTNNEHKSNAVALKEMLGLSGEPTVVLPSITSAPGGYTVTIGNIQTDAPINGYNIQLATATFEITKRNVTITNDQIDAIYGESEKSKSSTITFDAVSYNGAAQAVSSEKRIVPGNTITADDGVNQLVAMVLTTSRQDPDNKNVGEYPMSVEVPPACTAYYDVKVINSKYIIHPAMLTVTLSNLSAMYGAARNGKIESIDGFKWNDTQDSIGLTDAKLNFTMVDAAGNSGTPTTADVGEYNVTASVQGASQERWSSDWDPNADGKNYDRYDNYLVRFVDSKLTVTKRPIAINVMGGQTKVYGDSDAKGGVAFTLDPVNGKGGRVGSDFAGCVVTREVGETVGSYAYSDAQFQNAEIAKNYDITFNAPDKYTITKRTLTITVPNRERLYGSENPSDADITGALEYKNFASNDEIGIHDTVASLGGTVTIKYGVDNTVGKLTGVGTYPIVVSGYTSPNYNIVYTGTYSDGTSGTLTINALPVTIKGTTNSVRKYGVAGKNTPSYALYDETGSQAINVVDPQGSPLNIHIDLTKWEDPTTVVGNYEATISYDENPNYIVTIAPQATFQVTEADVSVTFNALQTTYGEKKPDTIAKEVSVNVNTSDGTQIYHDGENVTIKMNNENVILGTVRISVEATANASGLYDAGSYNLTFRLDKPAGAEHSIKVSEPDGKNMLIVHQMPLTITPRYGLFKTYGETDPSFAVNDTYVIFDYNTTSFAEPKADFAQARLSREAGENAGTYPIYSGDIFEQPMAKNYRISFTNDVRFTINKRTAVINLLETEKTYGETITSMNVKDYIKGGTGLLDATPEQEAEKAKILKGITLTSGATSASASVGSYALKAIYAQPANYDLTVIDSTITITARPITLTFKNYEKDYGDVDPAFTYDEISGNISNDGLKKNTLELTTGALSGSLTRKAGEDVGEYPISSTLYNKYGNYEITIVTGSGTSVNVGSSTTEPEALEVATLTIKPVQVTFTVAGGYNMTYGGTVPTFGYTVTGLKNNDTVASAFAGAAVYNIKNADGSLSEIPARPDAGDYTITMSGLTNKGAKNYDPIVFVDGSLHVDKRDVIVVVDAGQKKVYGEADPELTWTATGDGSYYVSEDAGDLSGLKVVRPDAGTSAGEDVGMHPMIIEGTDDNFNITRVNNDFEITPATLHVTLAPQSKIYGDENPVLSGDDLIIDGFVTKPVKGNTTPDNTGVLSNANLTFNFTDAEGAPATVASHTGVGKVVPAGVENVAANNYIFVYSAADFTINKRPITVTAKPQTSIYGDDVAVEDWSDYGTVNILEYTGDTAKAALVNGDILEGTNLCLVTSASHVGGYDIVPSFSGLAHRVGQASYQDYLVTAMNGTYTVTQRPLTWTIGTVGSVYGNDMAELSNTLTYTGDADKKTIVNGDDLKAVISITKKDVENAKAEEISMKSADGAASLVAESVPESVKDYGAYDMVGSYDNDDYLITIVNGVYTIGERLVEVTVTEPKDIVYGDTTNPDFTVNAVATNGDDTHGAAVKPDSLGLKMALVYTPFENDKTTDNAQTAPLTADAKATLTPDIASGDDGVESDSQFKTENVKNAGTYTYTVSSDYDAAVEQNYAVTIKVVDADKNEADGQFVIARKDLTVTLDPNPSTKLYGTKTVIPEVKTSGYAFDESVETVKLPAFELIVASSVDGIFGNVGLTKDAFKYVGGSYDNYNYLPATGDLEVKRLKLDDVKEPITITGTVFDEKTGKNVEVTKNFGDDLSKLYFNSAVGVSAPEGYAIGTSDSLTDADWAKKMVISDNGTKVTSDFYLIDLTTGAITSVGTVTSPIDTVVPVTVSAFTANAVDAATKTDLMNEKFTKFETAINIFITGEEIGKAPVKEDDKKTDDTEKKDDADKKDETEKKDETTDESKKDETVDKSEAETQRVAHGKPTKDKTEMQSVVEVKASVPAISKLDGEYNSGVAKIQYYKVNGTNIVKDTEGNYTFDESKFETVDVKNISKDNGYVSFNLSPDWTGYIVTRTVDKAGNYGDVRVMSVKLENPPAPETPRATATPAPAEEKPAPKLIVAAQAPTGVGLSANIVIPVIVVVALIAVGAVVIVKKKGGKKEEAAEKTEDKPEEKSEDESKEDKQ